MRKTTIVILLSLLVSSTALGGVRRIEPKPPAAPVVNVNDANETQLCYLPGVGPAIAGRIVEYVGGVDTGTPNPMDTIEELLQVKGIGPKKLDAMRPYITLTGPTTATAKIRPAKQ